MKSGRVTLMRDHRLSSNKNTVREENYAAFMCMTLYTTEELVQE